METPLGNRLRPRRLSSQQHRHAYPSLSAPIASICRQFWQEKRRKEDRPPSSECILETRRRPRTVTATVRTLHWLTTRRTADSIRPHLHIPMLDFGERRCAIELCSWKVLLLLFLLQMSTMGPMTLLQVAPRHSKQTLEDTGNGKMLAATTGTWKCRRRRRGLEIRASRS